MQVILASKSPRRKQLLGKIVEDFCVVPATSAECSGKSNAKELASDLALHKAKEVWQTHSDALVIGCDTVVELDGQILGKPANARQAQQMLMALSGRQHFVHTGVCVLCGKDRHLFCETTAVTFRTLGLQEVQDYIATGSPLDKAGAYGIQDCNFVSHFEGSYDNVVGLPTEQLAKILKKYKG